MHHVSISCIHACMSMLETFVLCSQKPQLRHTPNYYKQITMSPVIFHIINIHFDLHTRSEVIHLQFHMNEHNVSKQCSFTNTSVQNDNSAGLAIATIREVGGQIEWCWRHVMLTSCHVTSSSQVQLKGDAYQCTRCDGGVLFIFIVHYMNKSELMYRNPFIETWMFVSRFLNDFYSEYMLQMISSFFNVKKMSWYENR